MDAQLDPPQAEPERVRRLVEAEPVMAGVGLVGALERLCRAAVVDLGLLGATITLLPTAATHVVAAVSDDAAREVEELQFDAGEGPTGEASRASAPVLVPDLVGQALGRWPGFTSAATAAGVRAAFALPLHVGASRFGTLTLYRSAAGAMQRSEMRAALIYADLAVELLVDSSLPEDHTRPTQPGHDRTGLDQTGPGRPGHGQDAVVTPEIGEAFDAHSHVYQAQGMVMVQLGVSLAESLARMRAHAFGQELSLATLSDGIIRGTITLAKGHESP